MPLAPKLESLLDDARSEAKRTGDPGVGLIHLALVLAGRDPDRFKERFGAEGRVRVQEHLNAGAGRAADTDATVALLEGLSGDDPVQSLYDVIAAELADDLAHPPPAVERSTEAAAGGGADAVADGSTPQAEPAAPEPPPVVPQRTARYLELVEPDSTVIGRSDVVDQIISLTGQQRPAAPLVVAPAGAGRTALVAALATRLADPDYAGPLAGRRVVRVNPEAVVAGDRGAAVRRILEDYDGMDSAPVLAFDDLEVIAALGGSGGDRDLLGVLRGAVGDHEHHLVLLIDEAFVARLSVNDEELAGELTPLHLPPLSRDDLETVGTAAGAALAGHHGVTLPDEVARLALAPKSGADPLHHPGLAHARLDRACATAAMRADRTVSEADIGLGASPEVAPPDPAVLAARLGERIVGQDGAIGTVATRLALTRARLDLRPDRPDGVFLLIGPTGVGKTGLARAVCEALYGPEDAHLIRLDMSEYAQEWALSRLTGPQPGFVGYTEPEGWLTTRVRKQPESLLLLDEIEKAHPSVWNAFLQVFDAGRLSDARGLTADFSRVVVAMTSNIGADAFSAPQVGFGRTNDPVTDTDRILERLKDTMPPELINRIDEVVVFQPLSREAIRAIAVNEVRLVVERLRERGYVLTVDDAVVDHLAATGYDPMYGARHLQRNVERLFLQPLATVTGRTLRATVADGTISWVPADA